MHALDRALDLTVVPGYSRLGYSVRGHWWEDLPRMDGRVVLVTGVECVRLTGLELQS